jgi:tricarballylate dehydrogenase
MIDTQSGRRDLLVVGCGIAGLSAAVAAAERGLSVTVLERAPVQDYGGNTRWTESYLRMKNENEVSDDFEASLAENAGANLDPNLLVMAAGPYKDWPPFLKAHGMPDPELVSTFAAEAGPTLKWLRKFGIKFDALASYLLTTSAPRIMPIGGGLAMIEALHGHASRSSVDFHYETTASDLIRDETGAVTGVLARDANGTSRRFAARSTVLASGGFEGNAEMLTHYLGPRAQYIRPVALGGYYNKGEGIRMALAIGAAPAGDFGSYHAEPVDPRSRRAEAVIMCFPYGILVNTLGKRFIDEAPGAVDNNYDPISRSFAEQPKGIVYLILDQGIHEVPNWRKSVRTDQPPIEAATIAELAATLGLPAENLSATVAAYNAACRPGNFKPLEVDHLATVALDPPKSNWARPIKLAPYLAYPIISTVCFTFGGLKVDSKARVLDGDGRPIKGLFAAGETVGLYHQVYTGATSVLKGAVFGRLAGTNAAAAGDGDGRR